MEDFLGTWKLVKSVNYDNYLKALGIVKDLNEDVITETFSEEEDQVVWKIETTNYTGELRFTLDKEFQLDTLDNCMSVFPQITMSLNENQLVQVQKMDKIETTIILEVQGTNMIMTLKCDGVEAKRIYEKAVVANLSKATTQVPVSLNKSRNTKFHCDK
ncbi:Fatty acid-binding protein, brain [Bagarius yarrelli]|uniref:Fatty acid-binding protein, brain n=1 Tax=Bagarius yarrelli TaxID=175774 RepID=A0A556V505_BAGYA|nr:Fatty acid-binding protein, brain [Bagarius yarrelli]